MKYCKGCGAPLPAKLIDRLLEDLDTFLTPCLPLCDECLDEIQNQNNVEIDTFSDADPGL